MLSQTKHNPTQTAFHFPHTVPIPYTLTASSVKASANKASCKKVLIIKQSTNNRQSNVIQKYGKFSSNEIGKSDYIISLLPTETGGKYGLISRQFRS